MLTEPFHHLLRCNLYWYPCITLYHPNASKEEEEDKEEEDEDEEEEEEEKESKSGKYFWITLLEKSQWLQRKRPFLH